MLEMGELPVIVDHEDPRHTQITAAADKNHREIPADICRFWPGLSRQYTRTWISPGVHITGVTPRGSRRVRPVHGSRLGVW